MNRIISASVLFKFVKPSPVYTTFSKYQLRSLIIDTNSNENNRLRIEEEQYCNQVSTPLPCKNVLDMVQKETVEKSGDAHMLVSEVQAKTLYQLVKLLRPARILEIGGFTGYSAIAMGSALLPDAKLLSLELDPKHVAMARSHVKQANLQEKVEFKEGPAGDSLLDLIKQNNGTQYDLVFLDADKGGYVNYYELIMKHNLLSERGLILADNVLFYGQVHKLSPHYKNKTSQESLNVGYSKKTAEAASMDRILEAAAQLDAFNNQVLNDSRVEVVMLPLFDGLSLIRRKN